MSLTKGFTLLEMAVVIVIMGIVMAGFVLPMLGQIKVKNQLLELQKYKETKYTLEEIKVDLLGYVTIEGKLPCPDTDGDGKQNATCNSTTPTEGYIPWADLGLMKGNDAWGNPIRYRINHRYATTLGSTITGLNPVLKIKEQGKTPDQWLSNTSSSSSYVAAILFSCGRNGRPESTANNINNKTDCTNPNAPSPNSDDDFYLYKDFKKYFTEQPNSELPTDFDDILIWISTYQIVNQLTNAGKWK